MKVLAAMSGGVDSAVAAARAVELGHDVTGVHFALSADPAAVREGSRGCCTLSDARDARRAADVIGIPFYVWDLAERFRAEVIEDFVAEYAAGRTPNPCVRCNERIKFAAVLDRARALGFDAVCTGHYAIVDRDASGIPVLRRSVDSLKDQSYVLAVVGPEELEHTILPLGGSTKADVRDEAQARGLAVAHKPDSYDICFIPDGDTRAWLANRLGAQPGAIIDATTGEQVGSHQGSHGFTIGQRRGLALGRPAPDGQPRYVVGTDSDTNTVFVGTPMMLDVDELVGATPVWLDRPWTGIRAGLRAQVRAHGVTVAATAESDDDRLVVHLAEPIRAVAPGQTMVLYDEDRVVASATITRTRKTAAIAP